MPAPDSSAWRDEMDAKLAEAFTPNEAPAEPANEEASTEDIPPPPEAPESPVARFAPEEEAAEEAADVPAEDGDVPAPDERDARIASLEAQVASLAQTATQRQDAIEERLAKEEIAKLDRDIQILEGARERLVADSDEFDPAQYDRVIRRQQELQNQKAKLEMQQSQPRPAGRDNSGELAFIAEHRMTEKEQAQLGAYERYRVLQDSTLEAMRPQERWAKLLNEMRGNTAKAAPTRPKPRHSTTVAGSNQATVAKTEATLTDEDDRTIRAILGSKYYTKDRAKAVKESAAKRREENR